MTQERKKFLIVVILAFAVPLTAYLTIKGIQYLSRGAATTVNVSFSQSSLTLDPNAANPTALNIVTNANTSQVGFERVEFTFDQTKIMLASEIVPTTKFKKIIKQTTATEANSTGRVILVLGLDPSDIASPATGSYQFATLSIKAKPGATGSTNLTFTNSNMQIVDMTAVANTITSTNTTVNLTSATTPPTVAPTATATSPTSAQMNFTFKLQGINNQGQNKVASIVLTNPGSQTAVATFNNISVTSNASGLYSGQVTNITPGTYDVYLGSSSYLKKKFTNITLVGGTNSNDFSSTPLKAGDFNNSNSITITDVSLILSKYITLSVPVDSNSAIYDINNDSVITIIDISLILSNYTALTVSGD